MVAARWEDWRGVLLVERRVRRVGGWKRMEMLGEEVGDHLYGLEYL